MVYGNKEILRTIQRTKDVPKGYRGGTVDYFVPADRYFSEVSQADADAMAENDVKTDGQAYADKNAPLILSMFYNSELSIRYQRDNCEAGGGYYIYTVPEGKYISYDGQADADAKAKADADANGQKMANANASCCDVYKSKKVSDIFYSSKCEDGYEDVDGVEYTIERGRFTSTVSQEVADEMAYDALEEEGPVYADKNGKCLKIYYNDTTYSGYFTKKCREGFSAKEKYYEVAKGTVKSYKSVDDANVIAEALAKKNGQLYANEHTKCCPDEGYDDGIDMSVCDTTVKPVPPTPPDPPHGPYPDITRECPDCCERLQKQEHIISFSIGNDKEEDNNEEKK